MQVVDNKEPLEPFKVEPLSCVKIAEDVVALEYLGQDEMAVLTHSSISLLSIENGRLLIMVKTERTQDEELANLRATCLDVMHNTDPILIYGTACGSLISIQKASFPKVSFSASIGAFKIEALRWLGNNLLLVASSNQISLFEIQSRTTTRVLSQHRANSISPQTSSSFYAGKLAVSQGEKIFVWNLESGDAQMELEYDAPNITAVAFETHQNESSIASHGLVFYATDTSGNLLVYSCLLGRKLWECGSIGNLGASSLDVGKKWMIMGTDNERIVFYKVTRL